HSDRWDLADGPRDGRPDRDRRVHDHLLGAHRQHYGDHGHHGLEPAEHLYRHGGRRPEPHHLSERGDHHLQRALGHHAHRRAHRRPGELHGERRRLALRDGDRQPDDHRTLLDQLCRHHREPHGDCGHHGLESAEQLHRHGGRRRKPIHRGEPCVHVLLWAYVVYSHRRDLRRP